MKRLVNSVLLPAALLGLACNQPFEPDGAFDRRLVVYAILSASADTQFVRISRTYGTGTAPDVTDASVDIIPGNGDPAVHLRDTVVTHTDVSGHSASYNVYVAYNFRPKSRVNYRLQAASAAGGSIEGNTSGLGPADAILVNAAALTSSSDSLVIFSSFGTSTGAFVVHLYVEFSVTVNGITTSEREDVPVNSYADAAGNPVYQYPVFARVPQFDAANGTSSAYTTFPRTFYNATRAKILGRYPSGTVVLTGAGYAMTQIDDALYDYYYVLNGPPDPGTIRLDAPDYTNITNGAGVLACMQMIVREVRFAP